MQVVQVKNADADDPKAACAHIFTELGISSPPVDSERLKILRQRAREIRDRIAPALVGITESHLEWLDHVLAGGVCSKKRREVGG